MHRTIVDQIRTTCVPDAWRKFYPKQKRGREISEAQREDHTTKKDKKEPQASPKSSFLLTRWRRKEVMRWQIQHFDLRQPLFNSDTTRLGFGSTKQIIAARKN